MADRVRKVDYCYLTVPNRAGQGARILGELRAAGVNLLAYSGFPGGRGKAQIDLVPERMADLSRVARAKGWQLRRRKKAFLVTGQDEIGAVDRHVNRLADRGISITAADAVCAGKGRYGMILWVKPGAYGRAARALRAR